MKKVMLAVWLISGMLAFWTALQKSEFLLNLLSTWMSCAGLAFSLYNLGVRQRTKILQKDIRILSDVGFPGNYITQNAALAQRAEDGIVEGLLTAAAGSIVSSLGQTLFLM